MLQSTVNAAAISLSENAFGGFSSSHHFAREMIDSVCGTFSRLPNPIR
jgi:hypothetical protein